MSDAGLPLPARISSIQPLLVWSCQPGSCRNRGLLLFSVFAVLFPAESNFTLLSGQARAGAGREAAIDRVSRRSAAFSQAANNTARVAR
jgi:hypothetical protein